MDGRLEKIRRFQANVKDLESYISDRIKQTEEENPTDESFGGIQNTTGYSPADNNISGSDAEDIEDLFA